MHVVGCIRPLHGWGSALLAAVCGYVGAARFPVVCVTSLSDGGSAYIYVRVYIYLILCEVLVTTCL